MLRFPSILWNIHDLKIGDTITVKSGGYQKEFVISDYARDYEMNSSLTSSKRFVINQNRL